ncbi:MAG: TrkH family potassium uptake protein [bacterium]
MNYRMLMRINAYILAIEAGLMLPPLAISAYTHDLPALKGFVVAIILGILIAFILRLRSKNAKMRFHERDGFACVGIAWIIMSLIGCLPFFISGRIPNFIDALFEIVSGFTTTGASICPDVEALGRGLLWWRSFSHWIGGMGILVFFLALIPIMENNEGYSLHLLRAESPGPKVDKMVPRMRRSASMLYKIYIGLTVLDIIFLMIGGLPLYDACCCAFGTAGTGGFSILNTGCATYSPFAMNVTTIFMLLFGVNFSVYYLLILKRMKQAFGDEELKVYFGIVVIAVVMITINLATTVYASMAFNEIVRHSAFQVASIITTTGYSTVNFDLWPSFSKGILLILMCVGASAGSTGGGIKVARVILLAKVFKRNFYSVFHPKEVRVIKMNKTRVDEKVIQNTNAYLIIYIMIIVAAYLLVSLDSGNFSIATNISAVFATFNNIGPGFEAVGPTCNFSIYNNFSTLVLTMAMLLGRLEIFPMLVLFAPSTYKRK